jgi:hypothetical protein
VVVALPSYTHLVADERKTIGDFLLLFLIRRSFSSNFFPVAIRHTCSLSSSSPPITPTDDKTKTRLAEVRVSLLNLFLLPNSNGHGDVTSLQLLNLLKPSGNFTYDQI